MGDLIIKPEAGGSIKLQNNAGTDTLVSDNSGNVTLAGTTTLTNATLTTATMTAGTIGSAVSIATATFPAGHVLRTTQVHVKVHGGHISTTSSSAVASGITVSTPATTGSNYNIITFSSAAYVNANIYANVYLYANKNGAGYSRATGADVQSLGQHWYYADHRNIHATWVDTTGLTAGTNLYQIYMRTNSGTFYLVHNGNDYQLIVQEIQA